MEDFQKDITGIPDKESSIESKEAKDADSEVASENAKSTLRLSEMVANSPEILEPILRPIPKQKRGGHCIILYLPAIRNPIQLWNQTLITIGRKDKARNFDPTVDLSDHNASLLGVSRNHVEIIYKNLNYYVKDLGSKNGTWINKTRVLPGEIVQLNNHDTLRLGHFMIQVSTYQS